MKFQKDILKYSATCLLYYPLSKVLKKCGLYFYLFCVFLQFPNIRSEAVNIGNTLLFGNGNFDTTVSAYCESVSVYKQYASLHSDYQFYLLLEKWLRNQNCLINKQFPVCRVRQQNCHHPYTTQLCMQQRGWQFYCRTL